MSGEVAALWTTEAIAEAIDKILTQIWRRFPIAPPLVEICLRNRLQIAATGELCDDTRGAMMAALRQIAQADVPDDVAVAALEVEGDVLDVLLRQWASELRRPAQGLLGALLHPDDEPVPDPGRRWRLRLGAWLAQLATWVEQRSRSPELVAFLRMETRTLSDLSRRDELPGYGGPGLLVMVGTVEILARLTWIWTVCAWWIAERPRQKAPAVSLPAARLALALRRPTEHRTRNEGGRDLVAVSARGARSDLLELDLVKLPRGLADRLLSGDLRDLRSRAAVGVLDVLLRALGAELAREPFDGHRVPKLSIPAGRRLAELAQLAGDGSSAQAANDALRALASICLGDWRGTLQRFLLGLERVAHAPGRPAAWIVTPGELLLPSRLTRAASQAARANRLPTDQRAWRRFVPWPDVRAPDDWAGRTRDLHDAPWAAFALLVDWTEAAGLDHGRRWQAEPGVPVGKDAKWRELVERAGAPGLVKLRTAALDAWGDADWIAVDGDTVRPGAALPRLTEVLEKAAEKAKKRSRPNRRPHR